MIRWISLTTLRAVSDRERHGHARVLHRRNRLARGAQRGDESRSPQILAMFLYLMGGSYLGTPGRVVLTHRIRARQSPWRTLTQTVRLAMLVAPLSNSFPASIRCYARGQADELFAARPSRPAFRLLERHRSLVRRLLLLLDGIADASPASRQ